MSLTRQNSADGDDLEVVTYEKRKRRRRRRRRSKKHSASSSSENSDGDDVSSCMASREGISGDGEASSDAGCEASSVSTEIAPEFGSPDYWDYKRAQLKLMVADREKNKKKTNVFNVQKSQSDSRTQRTSKYKLPSLFLNREVFVAVGGTSRAFLVTNAPPHVDVNLQITCEDLHIIPSIIRLTSGEEQTRPFLFRASKICSPGQKNLTVTISGASVEASTFTVHGISVIEAISAISLEGGHCVLSVGAKRQGVVLRLNNRVQNAPLKASFESKSLSVYPEHFIIPPGNSKLGPFILTSKSDVKPGDAKLTVVLSGLSEEAQVNIPNNPHRLDVSGIKISKPVSSVKLEPPLERFLPGTMTKAKVVVNTAPMRDTKVEICPPNGITVSSSSLLLRSGCDRTEAIFFQSASDVKPGVYTIPINLISFSNSVEKRLCFELSIEICSSRNRALTGMSRASDDQDSSDVESLSAMSFGSRISTRSTQSSPRKDMKKEKLRKDDVSLEQLKHLLCDLQEQRSKLKGPNHLRKRNRVKRRIKAIQERVLEMEREQERQDESDSGIVDSVKRDPLHQKPPFVSSRPSRKRDPAQSGSVSSPSGPKPPPNGTIFARRRMSLPTRNRSESEASENACQSEIIFPRRPPRSVDKAPGSFELCPQVFTEMMDLPMTQWNTQHVCCWLHSLGMGFRKYVRLFQEFMVVGTELFCFREEQLRSMGIASEPHRKRILDELKKQHAGDDKNHPNELSIKKNVTNKLERDPPAKASTPTSTTSGAAKEMNPLFIINPNLTSIEINNQIKQLQAYKKKLKGSNRKRNKRNRCLETIQRLEMILYGVADSEKSSNTTSPTPPALSSIAPKEPSSDAVDSSRETQTLSRQSSERAFKTPKKSTESFRFQDSLFKDSDENAFRTLKKEYQHSNIQTKSDHDKSKGEEDLIYDAERGPMHLEKAAPLDVRDDISVSSLTLSELDDSEEFNAQLFTGLREEPPSDCTSDDEVIYSEPVPGGSRRHSLDHQTDEEDSSENEFSEISYGTPGYWAFKRRQLQDMASKRKRRLQAEARDRESSGEGLDSLLGQLQTRLRYLTIQKKHLGGSNHHRRFRIKIAKQMQTIQKRINQLHQAKRMRMTRLLDAQRKRKFEGAHSEEPVRVQKPAPTLPEPKTDRTSCEKPEKKEKVQVLESYGREKRKRLETETEKNSIVPKPKNSTVSSKKERPEVFSATSSHPPPQTPPRPVQPETRKATPLPDASSEKKKISDLRVDIVKSEERMPGNLDLLLSPSSGKTMTRTFQTRTRRKSNAVSTPANPSAYASASYWNNRYRTRKQPEEWYEGYKQLKDVLERYIQKSHMIMDLGCGDSSVQDQMREEGYEILGCDISSVVLERLASKKREMITADAYNLPFTNSSFDVVFDKGTLDALSCDKSRDLQHLFQEICRVLRPNGKYIVITPWNAPKRLPQLSSVSWRIQHEVIPMSLQTLATQRFNQLTDHPQFGRDKDTLMAMSYRQAAEQLKTMNVEEEKQKPPGQSCVMHLYVCAKLSRGISSV